MRTESALISGAMAGILLWLVLFTYSVEITVLCLALLALLYFPFGFYFLAVKGEGNLVYSALAGLLLFMAPVSVILSLLSLDQARLQAGIGVVVLPLLLILNWYLLRRSPSALRKYYKRNSARIIFWLLIVVSIYVFHPISMPRF